jgi:hypothetical protein
MLRVKTARYYQSVTLIKGAAVVASPIALFLLVHELFPGWSLEMILGGVAMAVALMLVLYLMRNPGSLRGHEFRCPQCEAEIAAPLENSGANREPILFLCKKCEVLWFTGSTNTD